MAEIRKVALASIDDTSYYIRFDMRDYKHEIQRRVQPLQSMSGGTVKDLGLHDSDRVISGKAVLTESQKDDLESMFESAVDTFFHLSDGTDVWRIAIQKSQYIDMQKTFYVYDCLFLVKQKDSE